MARRRENAGAAYQLKILDAVAGTEPADPVAAIGAVIAAPIHRARLGELRADQLCVMLAVQETW
jgi:hypothetical protein